MEPKEEKHKKTYTIMAKLTLTDVDEFEAETEEEALEMAHDLLVPEEIENVEYRILEIQDGDFCYIPD